jgi:hypothetical protein
VCNIDSLREFEVHGYQVILRGTVKASRRKH